MGLKKNTIKLSTGKKRLLDFLGKPYIVKNIDYESCIYLDLGNYDIEISGGMKINQTFDIFVWGKDKYLHTAEKHLQVPNDLNHIKNLLDDIRSRYLNK